MCCKHIFVYIFFFHLIMHVEFIIEFFFGLFVGLIGIYIHFTFDLFSNAVFYHTILGFLLLWISQFMWVMVFFPKKNKGFLITVRFDDSHVSFLVGLALVDIINAASLLIRIPNQTELKDPRSCHPKIMISFFLCSVHRAESFILLFFNNIFCVFIILK